MGNPGLPPERVRLVLDQLAAGRWAVQFHPESILTAAGGTGRVVIANVLRLCAARQRLAARPREPHPAS